MNMNERTSKIESQPKRAIVAVIASAIGLIVIALLAFSCTSAAPASSAGTIDASSIVHTKDSSYSPEGRRNDDASVSDATVEGEGSNGGMPTVQTADGQGSSQGPAPGFRSTRFCIAGAFIWKRRTIQRPCPGAAAEDLGRGHRARMGSRQGDVERERAHLQHGRGLHLQYLRNRYNRQYLCSCEGSHESR